MKPFITDAFRDGRFHLPFQVEGLASEDLGSVFLGANVLSCLLPENHSMEAAWLPRLVLDNEWCIDFSSACTEVGNWKEVGSLNLEFCWRPPEGESVKWSTTSLSDFCIKRVELLIYEDSEVSTAAGIVLIDKVGREIVVATGISPGSVSIALPLSQGSFRPEFPVEQCRRLPV